MIKKGNSGLLLTISISYKKVFKGTNRVAI